MNKRINEYKIYYQIIIGDREYPRELTMHATTKKEAENKLKKLLNKTLVDKFIISNTELQ